MTDSYYEPPDNPFDYMDDDEYDAVIEAQENAESMYWDNKISSMKEEGRWPL